MDTEGLLRSSNDHSVRHVVIGASAFPVHGHARATLDFDVFEPTPENARRTRDALIGFGYDLTDVSVDDLLRTKVLIRQYILEVDVHPFASLDDLIAMKEAAGRPKGLEDLRYLKRLRDPG